MGTRQRTFRADELPGVNTDPEENEFITALLEGAKSKDPDLFAKRANAQIDRTVAALRAFCKDMQGPVAASANGSAHWGGS